MNMHTETNNRRAFELVTEALIEIDQYKQSKEPSQLKVAKHKLERAQAEDPSYMRALYYNAMVNDLIGQAADAIDQFKKILEQHPPFMEEVRYNLAVACYHRYSREYLDEAAKHFQEVIDNTHDQITLNLLAHVGLAQTYAMRMIQPNPLEPDNEEVQLYFNKVNDQYDLVIEKLENIEGVDDETANEIRWAAHNARGMSLMYHSDYCGSLKDRQSRLMEALVELQKADNYSPHNWANYCDLGSANMRLGYWLDSQANFNEAINRLKYVVSSLRPNYGFALYEIGRTYRLMGNFKEAIRYFDEALKIEYKYRDVSDRRIQLEKDRAEMESKEYP
jgi:tetratricopeptide (TPR) repeat protein